VKYTIILLFVLTISLIVGNNEVFATVETFTIPIDKSSDDAQELDRRGGTVRLALTSHVIGGSHSSGYIFNDVQINSTQIITNAYIQFTSANVINLVGGAFFTIHGENNPNASTFTTENKNISDRPLVNESVIWNLPQWNPLQRGTAQQTPDLSDIIQEIIDKPTWQSGNSLAIIFDAGEYKDSRPNGFKVGYVITFDGDNDDQITSKPALVIEVFTPDQNTEPPYPNDLEFTFNEQTKDMTIKWDFGDRPQCGVTADVFINDEFYFYDGLGFPIELKQNGTGSFVKIGCKGEVTQNFSHYLSNDEILNFDMFMLFGTLVCSKRFS